MFIRELSCEDFKTRYDTHKKVSEFVRNSEGALVGGHAYLVVKTENKGIYVPLSLIENSVNVLYNEVNTSSRASLLNVRYVIEKLKAVDFKLFYKLKSFKGVRGITTKVSSLFSNAQFDQQNRLRGYFGKLNQIEMWLEQLDEPIASLEVMDKSDILSGAMRLTEKIRERKKPKLRGIPIEYTLKIGTMIENNEVLTFPV